MDLDNLNIDRASHACSRYQNNQGLMVNVVCGGITYPVLENYGGFIIQDCEINVEGMVTWTEFTALPRGSANFGAITIDNRVFMVGE